LRDAALDAATIPFHMLPMQPDQKDQPEATRWALPVSVATHLVVVALLVFGLPQFDFSPPQEQAVDVQLVPPPEPVKPQPLAPTPPPAPKPEPKPEPKKAEAALPPPPSPAAAPKPAVMQPVVEFGKKESGPRKSPDGDSAEDKPAEPKPDTQAAEDKPAEPKPEPADDASSGPRVAIVKPAEANKPKQAEDGAKPAEKPRLAKAKTLFSQAMTDDPVARTAIGKIPRDRRGGTLCGTELREQLVRGSPSYIPELLPSVRLTKGTVIDVKAAFNASGVWRAVAFRCEVDKDAMKVVSFSHAVGDLIPRSEWKRLGLPSQ
jgi:hypothetical protein